MENWKETYPYVTVKRVRQFEDEKFEISDVVPPKAYRAYLSDFG